MGGGGCFLIYSVNFVIRKRVLKPSGAAFVIWKIYVQNKREAASKFINYQ